MAQTDPWVGTWTAPEQDRGVTVWLTIGQSSTLVIPGIGPGGKVAALTLLVRDFRGAAERAIFMVDLPDKEGVIEWELRARNTRDVSILRALTLDGEPADDDTPSWTLRHQLPAFLRARLPASQPTFSSRFVGILQAFDERRFLSARQLKFAG